MANHSDPESCVAHREVWGEALTGDTGRPAIEPRNQEIGMPTELTISEGNTEHGGNRKSCSDPARSKTLSMPGKRSAQKLGGLGGAREVCGRGGEGE